MTERFTLLTELGRGGMGIVWKARDEETGRIVALKLLREAYSDDPAYLNRFERELELARRIDSIHVVRVLGFGVRQKVPYLALEYVDGRSLHQALAAHGAYSWPETQAMLIQIAQGLADANAVGVVHRDVKPSNVVIGSEGIAKLTDFGIARGLDLTRLTATSTMLGTPAYLAPEGPKDGRSDLYSLGIIGYELLTGAPPFTGNTYQDVIIEHMSTPPDLEKLPAEARSIIGWLLAKNPAERPQEPDALLQALRPAVPAPTQDPAAAGPSPASAAAAEAAAGPSRNDARRKLAPRIAGLGAAALVVCIVTAALAARAISNSSSTPAPTTGTFSRTGSMTTPRGGHAATRLTDDRVLIGGGSDSSVDLYDPHTDTFTSTGSMGSSRPGYAAVLLTDGRVLVAGGYRTASAELYDPKTGRFSSTGSMSTSRWPLSATLLADGEALVAGGSGGTSAELYDPKTGRFSSTGSMTAARFGQTATLLSDGRVLLVGGDTGTSYFSSAELYDPTTRTFSTTGSMTAARSGQTATLLADGRVLIAGGYDGTTYLGSAELFNPKTGLFRSAGSMTTARSGHTATLLPDGRVLIVGGSDSPTAELYDPAAGAFRATGSMATSRSGHTATLLADGRVLIAGGPSETAELYTP